MNSGGRIATEKLKLVQEKCQGILTAMLKDEDNKYCVDCDAKGPRWASWNLGVFLCIRCAGIHRNLGVHISKVKSVNLDTWKPEQAVSLQQMGNSRARAVYEANLPDNFRRPQTDSALEAFIRAKYEQNKYTAREWVPPRPPKVNWDAEIEAMTKEHKKSARSRADSSARPALVKPLPAPCSASTSATVKQKPKETPAPPVSAASPSAATDLLGLDTPSPAASATGAATTDPFGDFLSATPVSSPALAATAAAAAAGDALAADEASFFSQSAADEAAAAATKVMSRDSILALYGSVAGGGSGGGAPAGGGMAGFTSMPAVSSAAGYAGQQPMSGGLPCQQPVPGGFPPQQQPAGFSPAMQHQQMTGFPPQQPRLPAGFPGQQGFGALYSVAGQQPHYVRQTPGYQSVPCQQQQQQQHQQQQPPALAGAGQTFGMTPAPSSLPSLGHHQMHQQMAGLSLGAQQLPVGAVGGAAVVYPALSSGQAVNGQLWQ